MARKEKSPAEFAVHPSVYELFVSWIYPFPHDHEDEQVFTESLVSQFLLGLSVTHPGSKAEWFATLQNAWFEDNQLSAVARISHKAPREPVVPATIAPGPDRNRKPFQGKPLKGPTKDADLILMYAFPRRLSVEDNVGLFVEFAGNELARLRGDEAGHK